MQNYKIVDKGGTHWISRSCCTGCFIFAKNYISGRWFVLANKRGAGCPNEVGKWNCVGGYVDYDETLEQSAIRETYEETGLKIYEEDLRYAGIFSTPIGNVQNITVKYYAKLKYEVDWYRQQLTIKHSEDNEVSEVRFIAINDIDNFDWAFNHRNIIMDLYKNRINIPWWKKIILWAYERI